jgi:hypothetical protein
MKEFFQTLDWGMCESCRSHWGCVVGTIVAIVAIFFICRPRSVPMVRGEWGTIFLKKSAIREIVKSMAGSVGFRGKICVKIVLRGERVSVEVTVWPYHWQNLAENSRSLHESLYNVLVRDIGLEKIGKINVLIAGFLCPKNHDRPDEKICQCEGESCQSAQGNCKKESSDFSGDGME